MKEANKEKIYSKDQIECIILESSKSNISNVAVHKRINKMIASGELSRIGNGQYVFAKKKKFNYHLENNVSLNILNKLENELDKSAKYIIYESTLLNMFLNHLIARPTIIVEAEKNIVDSVFWLLREEGLKNVLLKPSANENYLYNPYDGSGVIIKTLVSKSPINNKLHQIIIEKLVVDIVCDKTLNMFYEGAEIPNMVEEILKNYEVKFDSIKNYAKRRHCFDTFIKFAPEELKGFFND